MQRTWSRVLLVALLTTIGFLLSGAAQATPGDCKGDAPMPIPAGGMTVIEPAHPSTADPFAPGSTTPLADVYDVTKVQFWNYDNGCTPGADFLPATGASIGSLVGMRAPGSVLNWLQGILGASLDSTWLKPLDQPLVELTTAIHTRFWGPWASVALTLVSAIMLWRSRTGDIPRVITAATWALTVFIVSSWLLAYPTDAIKIVDSTVQTASTDITTAFAENTPATRPDAPASEVVAHNVDALARVQYQSWLTAVFGSSDSATAIQYGPKVFAATHMSWVETKTYNSDVKGAGKKIVEDKQDAFKKLAEQIHTADPVAYEYFTGNQWQATASVGVLNFFMILLVAIFPLLAAVGILMAYLLVRFAVPVGPVAGVIFMLETFRNLCMGYLRKAAPILVMGPLYLLLTLLVLRLDRAIWDAAGMSLWAKLLLMVGITMLAWRISKPGHIIPRPHIPSLSNLLALTALWQMREVQHPHPTPQLEPQPAPSTELVAQPSVSSGHETVQATFVPDHAASNTAPGQMLALPAPTYDLPPTDGAAPGATPSLPAPKPGPQPGGGGAPATPEPAIPAVWLPAPLDDMPEQADRPADSGPLALPVPSAPADPDPQIPWSPPAPAPASGGAQAPELPAPAQGDIPPRPGQPAEEIAAVADPAPQTSADPATPVLPVVPVPQIAPRHDATPAPQGHTDPAPAEAPRDDATWTPAPAQAQGAHPVAASPEPAATPETETPHQPTVLPQAGAQTDARSETQPQGQDEAPGMSQPVRLAQPTTPTAATGSGDKEVIQGALVSPTAPMPADIAPANTTLDEWGRPVFVVYSPQGSQTIDMTGEEG